jgi:hypothetical protein
LAQVFVDNQKIHEEIIELNRLTDNQYMDIHFSRSKGAEGKKMKVTLSSLKYIPGNEVTIWSSGTKSNFDLTINGIKEENTLVFQATKKSRVYEQLTELINKTGNGRVQIVFLFTALLYGLMNSLIYVLIRNAGTTEERNKLTV